MFVDIGWIVDHHSMTWGERWFLSIPPISTNITSHFNSLSDGQQFHQYQQKSPLTSTHWVMVNNSTNIKKNHLLVELLIITQWVEVGGDFCWYWWNCWPSLNELKWEMILVDISGIVDHHSKNWGEPLTSTHWVMVNNSTNINSNHLSTQLIEWWSTIEVIGDFVDISGIVDHHSMSWSGRWFLLILVELLTITQWVEVRDDSCWY
jgi:hypothetical protein